MLIDIKSRLNEPDLQLLLSYAVFSDPDKLEIVVQQYTNQNHDSKLLGFESEGDVIGLVGYTWMDTDTIEIKHIAVIPEERGKGYGRGLILDLLQLEKPNVLLAETDEEAVEFYRNNGFMIESLGEKYPGVERYKCTFFADEV